MTTPSIMPPRTSALASFGVSHPIFGVVHLRPLPGAPSYDGQGVRDIYAAGVRDAVTLATGGIDAVMVENASDQPFLRPDDIGPETVAALAAACEEIRGAVSVPMGITCVANGAIPALAIAKAVGADWVRVNQWANAYVANEGMLNGDAARALRYRAAIGARNVKILADVHVKFGAHAITADRSISEQASDAEWHLADVLIATGTRTGSPTSAGEVREVRSGTSLPVIVGSGLDPDQLPELFRVADGAIIGQWLKQDGHWWNPVDPKRVDRLVSAAATFRASL
jgi:membrane complex biogenesis BtpA family protein